MCLNLSQRQCLEIDERVWSSAAGLLARIEQEFLSFELGARVSGLGPASGVKKVHSTPAKLDRLSLGPGAPAAWGSDGIQAGRNTPWTHSRRPRGLRESGSWRPLPSSLPRAAIPSGISHRPWPLGLGLQPERRRVSRPHVSPHCELPLKASKSSFNLRQSGWARR